MAENTPLYESISNVYNGPALGVPNRDIFGQGVVGANDLLVSAHAAANSIDVAAGVCWVTGDTDTARQPTYRCFNDAVVNLGISPDPTFARYIRVVAQVNDADFAGGSRNWVLTAIHGAATGTPSLPSEPASALTLASIFVPAAAASSAAYTITDARVRATIGGGQALLLAPTRTVILNGTVSYTTPAGTSSLLVEAVGAGGGGGGVNVTTAGQVGVGGGGGGGAYSSSTISSPAASYSVAVGAGGTAGAAGGAGGVGGDTTFSATVVVAKGGLGGSGMTQAAAPVATAGGAGGPSSTGTGQQKADGGGGMFGLAVSAAAAGLGGAGGGAPEFGAPGVHQSNVAANGVPANPYGGGGGGGVRTSSTAGQTGAAGAAGVLVITAYP